MPAVPIIATLVARQVGKAVLPADQFGKFSTALTGITVLSAMPDLYNLVENKVSSLVESGFTGTEEAIANQITLGGLESHPELAQAFLNHQWEFLNSMDLSAAAGLVGEVVDGGSDAISEVIGFLAELIFG